MRSGSLSGQTIDLRDVVSFGRSEGPPGNLGGDDQLSRRHASVTRTPDRRVVIEDLGSSNGTFVNGRRIVGATTLAAPT